MDPIGISALALSVLSSDVTKDEISTVAKKSTKTILIAFVVVLITGDLILRMFGIDEHSLKVMGGLVLLLMAISMVNGSSKKDKNKDHKENEELAIIPIGIPIAFGTGLFTTIIIFKHQAETALDLVSISLAFSLNALAFYLVLKTQFILKNI